MIIKPLTPKEFENFLRPIFRLEPSERVYSTFYGLLKLPTYKGFDIQLERYIPIVTDLYQRPRITLRFTKKKSFWDDVVDPTNRIVNDLKFLCTAEIPDVQFALLPAGGFGHESLRILYQQGTYNPNWEKEQRISPLIIAKTIKIKENGQEYYVVECSLCAECYQRKANKTILKKDWKELLRRSVAYWV
jgi:hypothetical protein